MVNLGAHVDDARRPVRTAARARTGSDIRFAAVSAVPAIEEAWAALAGRSSADNVFFRPEFAGPAMANLGRGVALATVADAAGALTALAPFTRTRLGRIAPAARLFAHDYAPLGLPLVDGDQTESNLAALLQGLAPVGSGISLIIPDLPIDHPVAATLIGLARRDDRPVDILNQHERAVLDRDASTLDLRAALPARRRKEFGRQLRRLSDLGAVRFETFSRAGSVGAFEMFLALEAAGWKGRNNTALTSSPQTAVFARDAVRVLAASGHARIDALMLDNAPVAMLVTLIAGATAYTWKIAYDEAHARFSPGAQLMLDVPSRIFADPAIARIDSLATADHPMIDHLWEGRMAVGTVVIGPVGGSLLHSAGLAAARSEIRARAFARRLLKR